MSVWQAARYILSIPTIRVLILSSALGYFFLGGLRTFAVIFAQAHFGLSHGVVSLLLVVIGAGTIAGTLAGGRLADRLISRGVIDSRPLIAGAALVCVALVLVPGMVSTSIAISLPLLVLAGAMLGAPNAPLDAARLDILPSRLWGRGEAVRTFIRTLFEAFAPLLFGFVSSVLGAGSNGGLGAGINSAHSHVTAAQGRGLEYTFLIMVAPLVVSGLLLLRWRRRYLTDVAVAHASEWSSAHEGHGGGAASGST
jgi:predicted MFS family arabinose efflux permease